LKSVSVSTPRNAIDGQVTELETKQFTHFESHNIGCQDTPGGVSPELPVVDSLVLLEVVSSETQESQVDAQYLTISLNPGSSVQCHLPGDNKCGRVAGFQQTPKGF
jgi:hypothetical protein